MDRMTYSECIELPTFEERYRYLRLTGIVGEQTFAHQRHLNQTFYTSREWRDLRNHIITRDLGRDLACEGYEIFDAIYIHHINPITPDDVLHRSKSLLDPENLITVSLDTHNAIHYGTLETSRFVGHVRTEGDTILWRPYFRV